MIFIITNSTTIFPLFVDNWHIIYSALSSVTIPEFTQIPMCQELKK